MTTKFTKTFAAAVAAAVIGVAALAAPAMAAGPVSISLTPTDPDQQQAILKKYGVDKPVDYSWVYR